MNLLKQIRQKKKLREKLRIQEELRKKQEALDRKAPIVNKKQKREPAGGHHFVIDGTTIKGETFDEVVTKVNEYRRNNNLPVGDTKRDITLFYAKNWPYMVIRSEVEYEPKIFEEGYIKWRDWVYKTWSNPPAKFITKKEAEDRWDVCKTCPFNKPKNFSASPELSEINRRTFLMSRGLEAPSFLGYCALHSADLPTLVYADNPATLLFEKDNEPLENCWVK